MYNQNYEDYMRSILGYNPNYTSANPYENSNYQNTEEEYIEDERLYPEIYRMVNPMVCKACNEVHTNEITENMVNEITDSIFVNIEVNETTEARPLKNGDVPNPNAKNETRHTRQNNPLLRDLIKILVLRNLYDKRRRPPIRPTIPRPPFPGGPGPFPGGPNRPIMPRSPYEDLYY